MSTPVRGTLFWCAGAAAASLLAACVATGGGYYDGGGAYYSGGYYEPFGYDYGGWGRTYHVAPGRGGGRGHEGPSHAYRSAPSGHASPSLPSRARRH